jgi:hypothetical protein
MFGTRRLSSPAVVGDVIVQAARNALRTATAAEATTAVRWEYSWSAGSCVVLSASRSR